MLVEGFLRALSSASSSMSELESFSSCLVSPSSESIDVLGDVASDSDAFMLALVGIRSF